MGGDDVMGLVNGKVALVTGGASGIGKASAERLAQEGATVVVTDVQVQAGEAVVAGIVAAGGKASFLKHDVSSEDEWIGVVAEVRKLHGRLDILVNNAGIGVGGLVTEMTLELWRKQQSINVEGVFLGVKHSLPLMRDGGGKGSIINTASFVATMGAATSQISYTASKGGVLAMSRELGVQFAREGIRVNALSPGPVNTPLLQELFAKDKERAARRLVHIPMGRFANPEEIAAAVAFLASDDSSFITSSNFLVDGGISGAYVTPL